MDTLQSAAAEGRAAKEALLAQSAAAVESTECQRQLAAQVEAAHAEHCSLRHQGEQMASEHECLKKEHRLATAELKAMQARIEKVTAEHKVCRPHRAAPPQHAHSLRDSPMALRHALNQQRPLWLQLAMEAQAAQMEACLRSEREGWAARERQLALHAEDLEEAVDMLQKQVAATETSLQQTIQVASETITPFAAQRGLQQPRANGLQDCAAGQYK